MLMRANPKLSGNIKLTVDSTGNLWLNSIDANDALSATQYKRYRVPSDGSYDKDLYSCFGNVNPEILFQDKLHRSLDTTSTNYEDQYDFFYSAGAYPMISNFYSEDYGYLAPLWLKNVLPDYFVIFRVDEPTDFSYVVNTPSGEINSITTKTYRVLAADQGSTFSIVYAGQTYTTNQTFQSISGVSTYTSTGNGKVVLIDEYRYTPIDYAQNFTDLISRSTAVKTFDLTEESEIGRYLRKMIADPRFPSAPLSINFNADQLSTWNGYAYKDGVISSKGENLYNFFASATTQIGFEEYITNGFERHSIICPQLLNLEFLFEDPNIPKYSIPRYFGFYCSANELGQFELSGSLLTTKGSALGNSPQPVLKQGYKSWTKPFYQTNNTGVRLFHENENGIIPNSSLMSTSLNRLFYVKDKKKQIHSVNQKPSIYGQYGAFKDIQLKDTTINVTDFTGAGKTLIHGKGFTMSKPGNAHAYITITGELNSNDWFKIYTQSGLQIGPDGRYDKIIANDLRRAFTVLPTSPGSSTVLLPSDLTAYYNVGDTVQIVYGQNIVEDKIISIVSLVGLDTVITFTTPLKTTVTTGHINIVRDWGPGKWLASDDFTTVYFHPLGTKEQIATAIAGALRSIETRKYNTGTVGSDVIISLITPGKDGNNNKIEAYLQGSANATIMGVPYQVDTKRNFEGGTNVARTRLKFLLKDIKKLQNIEAWINTVGGIGKVSWVGRYTEEPQKEIGGSDIVTYKNWDKYACAYIEDDADEVIVGTTKQFVAFSVFKVSTGVLSVFPVKDLDGDFYSSSYGKSPDNELYRYFNLQPGNDNIITDRSYIVKGTTTDSILYNGTIFNAGDVFIGISGVPSFAINSGTPFVIQKIFTKKIVLPNENLAGSITDPITYLVVGDSLTGQIQYTAPGDPAITVYAGNTFLSTGGIFTASPNTFVYLANDSADASDIVDEIKSFAGFWKLKDIMTVNDATTATDQSTQYQLYDKFRYLDIYSEYDFLKENFLKENATKSRMHQRINKWAYLGGKDVRDNPYRLNTNAGFGTYNFSPSLRIRTQNPEAFTHEWFYLESRPFFYNNSDMKDNYWFFENPLNLNNIKDANPLSPDYFTDYFTYTPTTENSYQERYSTFVEDNGIISTMFKGLRFIIRDIQSGAESTTSGKPQYISNSKKYKSYKFSTILKIVKENPGTIQSPITITFHSNETTKSIVCVIELVSDDYRTIQTASPVNLSPAPIGTTVNTVSGQSSIIGDLDLTSYIGQQITVLIPSNTFVSTILNTSTGSPYFQTFLSSALSSTNSGVQAITGFNYQSLLTRAVDYFTLYTMKSKRSEATYIDSGTYATYGLDASRPGDIKLSVALDLSYPSTLLGSQSRIYAIPNPNYDWDLRDEVRNFQTYNKFTGSFYYGQTQYPYPTSSAQKFVNFGIPNGSYQFEAPVGFPVSIPSGSNFDWQGFPQVQAFGGTGYFEPIMQRLSAASICEKINNYSNIIKYVSYTWDKETSTTKVTNNTFYLEAIEHSVIQKSETYLPSIDTDKPEQLSTYSIIGATVSSVPVSMLLARHSGSYEPMFKDILFFEAKDQGVLGSPIDLKYSNSLFRTSVTGFSLIQNHGILKVAPNNILALAGSSFKSEYPFVGECAIDYRDISIFASSWDPDFYRLYTSPTLFTTKAGTRNMTEYKNYFGSKLMKTQDTVQLMTWDITKVDQIESVDPDTMTEELVWAETQTKIIGYINTKPRLRRFFIEDGAGREFYKYVLPDLGVIDPSTLDDDIKQYLDNNVVIRYEGKQITPYTLIRPENGDINNIIGNLTDTQKLTSGFVKAQNFNIQRAGTGKFVYQFSYTKTPNFDIDIAFSVLIERI